MVPDAQKALGADIRLLGDLLGQAIRRLAGEDAFDLEEDVRAAAKELRANPSLDEAARGSATGSARSTCRTSRTLIRAFSVFFDLINLAEQQARVRALRHRAAKPGDRRMPRAPRRPCGTSATAASTPTKSPTTSRGRWSCRSSPPTRARPGGGRSWRSSPPSPSSSTGWSTARPRRRAARGASAPIAEEVETFWLTDTVRAARPTVLDEVRQGLGLVETRLFDVVPEVYRELEAALAQVYPGYDWRVPAFLQFGSGSAATATATRTSRTPSPPRPSGSSRRRSCGTTSHRVDDLGGGSATPTAVRRGRTGPRASRSPADAALLARAWPRRPTHEPYRAEVPADRREAPADARTTSRTHDLDWGEEGSRRRPGVYLGRAGAARRPAADRRRPPPRRRHGRGRRRGPRPDPAGRGVRPPPADARPPPAQRPARRRPLDEVFAPAGRLRELRGAVARRAVRAAGAASSKPTRPLIPAHLPFSRRDGGGGPDVPHDGRGPGAAVPGGARDVHHQLDHRAGPPAGGAAARPRGPAVPPGARASAGSTSCRCSRRSSRSARRAPIMERLLDLPVYRRHLELRGDRAGGDDRLLRQQQGERLPAVGVGAVPGADGADRDWAAGRASRAVLPRPRRRDRPRRRAGQPRHPGPAARARSTAGCG